MEEEEQVVRASSSSQKVKYQELNDSIEDIIPSHHYYIQRCGHIRSKSILLLEASKVNY